VKDLQLLGKELRESMRYSAGRAPRNLLEALDLFDKGFSKLTGKTVRFKRFSSVILSVILSVVLSLILRGYIILNLLRNGANFLFRQIFGSLLRVAIAEPLRRSAKDHLPGAKNYVLVV